jgi:hypothetical protein
MPVTSKKTAPEVEKADGFEGHYDDLDGYTVGFETYSANMDCAPLFVGLPDDRCQCPHWGVVLKGKITFRYADHDEEITTGQAYYAKPGHTPILTDGTEVVEFSPTAELGKTMEVVMANMAAMSG